MTQTTPAGLPRSIENPVIGDRVVFLKTAEETAGAYTLVEVTLNPGGGTGLHLHVDYTEEFTAIEGFLGIQLGKRRFHLEPGATALVPLNIVHRFFNDGAHPITFRVKIAPASDFETMLRISYGLAGDGRCNAKGLPRSIWHLMLIAELGGTYFPGLPVRFQKWLFRSFARIARRKNIDRELRKYLEPVGPRQAMGIASAHLCEAGQSGADAAMATALPPAC